MNVRDFYETFPYPPRSKRETASKASLPSDFAAINHTLFRGIWPNHQEIQILVAGCGTGDAVVSLGQQLTWLDIPFKITGIDVSNTSLAIAEERVAAANLDNRVSLHHQAIEDLGRHSNGVKFHYVDLNGVLNHVDDPRQTLSILHDVITNPGGMGVMVYGALGRTGIYPFQDALRQLQLTCAQDIPEARKLLTNLPESNWIRQNPLLRDSDKIGDTEFADRFMNPLDRAFNVRELCRLFSRSGMRIVEFSPSIMYDPKTIIRGADLTHRIDAMTPENRWHLAEQLLGCLNKHIFFAVRADGSSNCVADESNLALRAVIRGPTRAALIDALYVRGERDVAIGFTRDGVERRMRVAFSNPEVEVLKQFMDGLSIGEIVNQQKECSTEETIAAISRVCRALNGVGAMYLNQSKRH